MSGSIITVTNTNDSGAGSLRQAILDAGTDPDVCINFDEDLKGQTITLQNYLLIDSGQDIMITGDVDGDGEIDITISGDANGNGTVDIADPGFLFNALYVPGSIPPPCLDAADSNDDGTVNNADVVHILAVLFSGATPLAPYPLPGFDPTQDVNPASPSRDLGCN